MLNIANIADDYKGLAIFVWVFLAIVLVGAIYVVLQQKKTVKTMLLGMSFILFGGVIALDPSSNLDRYAYALQLIGFILTIIGFLKNDHE